MRDDDLSRLPPPEPRASHEAKVLAAAYLRAHVGDSFTAWGMAEDLANMPEIHQDIRRWANAHVPIAISYLEGIKSITGQERPKRARDYFQRFLEEENIIGLPYWIWHPHLMREVKWWRLPKDWQDRGFTIEELEHLRERFEIFWENRNRQ